jgi:ankyrin repeat protein
LGAQRRARGGGEAAKGANLRYRDQKYSHTPLPLAAKNGHEAVVKLLLEKGAGRESRG